MTDHLSAESASWFSEVGELADELVIFIDVTRADVKTRRYARAIATRVINLPGRGYIEAHLEEMVHACHGEWVLRLDSDERLSGDWTGGGWRELLQTNQHTHYICPRRWMHPAGGFLQVAPWWPDHQVRLFRNDPAALRFPALLHEPMFVPGHGGYLPHLAIEHHVLRLKNRREREEKVHHYRHLRPDLSLGHYYLVEDDTLPVRAVPPIVNGRAAELARPTSIFPASDCARVQIRAGGVPSIVTTGKPFFIPVVISNAANHTLSSIPPYAVHIAYHWLGDDGESVTFDGVRSEISPPVHCRERAQCIATVFPPNQPGCYLLQLTLVQEKVRWFETAHPTIVSEHHIEVIEPGTFSTSQSWR